MGLWDPQGAERAAGPDLGGGDGGQDCFPDGGGVCGGQEQKLDKVKNNSRFRFISEFVTRSFCTLQVTISVLLMTYSSGCTGWH